MNNRAVYVSSLVRNAFFARVIFLAVVANVGFRSMKCLPSGSSARYQDHCIGERSPHKDVEQFNER